MFYEQTKENKIRIYKDRARYDYETIQSIINDSHVVHVAYCRQDGQLENMPMIGALGYDSDEPVIYLHGNAASLLYKGAKSKIKVCITATQVDGIVMAYNPNGHSLNYRSAIIHGEAELVLTKEETLYAMKTVVNHLIPNRWDNINPVSEKAINFVKVIKVRILSASAKVRTGFGAGSVDNEDVIFNGKSDVWSGVVPLYRQFGEPVESSYNKETKRPVQGHIIEMINKKNKNWEDYSRNVSSD